MSRNESRPVPRIYNELDIKNPNISSPSTSTCTTDSNTTEDITCSVAEHMELLKLKHENDRDDKVVNTGFKMIGWLLSACLIVSFISICYEDLGMLREFYTISTTTITLVLGYLFGSRKNLQ